MIKSGKAININNEKSFKLLFQEYFPALCNFAYGFIKNRDVCEDVVQDVFIKLWERRVGFNDLTSIKVFLYKATRNDCLSFIKHKKVEEKYLGECAQNDIDDKVIINKIIEEETHRLMYEVICSLPKKCQKIIKLHLDGISNVEIAEILHISINTVKTQKKIAYKIFREKIKNFILLLNI